MIPQTLARAQAQKLLPDGSVELCDGRILTRSELEQEWEQEWDDIRRQLKHHAQEGVDRPTSKTAEAVRDIGEVVFSILVEAVRIVKTRTDLRYDEQFKLLEENMRVERRDIEAARQTLYREDVCKAIPLADKQAMLLRWRAESLAGYRGPSAMAVFCRISQWVLTPEGDAGNFINRLIFQGPDLRKIVDGWQCLIEKVEDNLANAPSAGQAKAREVRDCEGRVEFYLGKHPGARIRDVARAVGLSHGKIGKTKAWKQREKHLENKEQAPPASREEELTKAIASQTKDDKDHIFPQTLPLGVSEKISENNANPQA